MASNIVSLTIDDEYPVAGVDNDSQGFRDNFRIIKDSLAAAKEEMEDLQTKVVLKSALTDTDLDNNLAGTSLIAVNLDQATQTVLVSAGVSNNQNVSFTNGHYQAVSATGDITLTLSDWPDEGYAKMTVELSSDSATARTITFLSENTGTFKRLASDSWDAASTATSLVVEANSNADPVILEYWTADGGATVFARHLGQFE